MSRVWRTRVGNGAGGNDVKLRPVHNGKIALIASNDGDITRYQLDSGEQDWTTEAGQAITAGIAVGGGNVFVGTKDGWVEAYALKDGKFKWRQQLSSEILSRPAVNKNVLGVRTVDGQISGLDVRTGKVLWKASIGVPQLSIRRQADMLTLSDLFLIATSKGRLVAFQAQTGRQAISVPLILGKGKTRIERMSDFSATPFLMGRVLILSAYGQETLAVDLQSQKVLWESPIHSAQDLFADRRFVYLVAADSTLYAVHLQSGKVAWKNDQLVGRKLSPPDGNGIFVTVSDYEGYTYLLDSNNGRIAAMQRFADARSNVGVMFFDASKFLSFSESGEINVVDVMSPMLKQTASSKKTPSTFSLPNSATGRVPTTTVPKKKYSFSNPTPKKPNTPKVTPKKPSTSTPLSFPSN